jgi:GDP/UDP-N,N'-diacetylbacillosamine 2-epimerase (hydrolysing)
MIKRKIAVITGTRAEFGLLKPVMTRIRDSEVLRLQTVVTGMHLLPEFGKTIEDIRDSGFDVDARVPMIVGYDDKSSMATSIGVGIIACTQALDILNPDIVLALGDRFEAFAAVIAASYSGRIVAHLSGGDSPQAGYDEYTRHAITKISHIHFPSTAKSAQRIIKMGENPKFVFPVGSTALDTIMNTELPPPEKISRKYDINTSQPFILLVQHPLSTRPDNAEKEITETLQAVLETGYQVFVIYPNVDPGGRKMIEVIEEFSRIEPEKIRAFKSLPFEDYLGVMKVASVMVGNSSSGIIESSSFHLPVINIGPRQQGRERAQNVIDVPNNKNKIRNAVNKALHDEVFRDKVRQCKNPYGDGRASERIVEVLSSIKLDKSILRKKLTY